MPQPAEDATEIDFEDAAQALEQIAGSGEKIGTQF